MWKKADTQKLKSKIEEMSNNILEKFNINTLWDYFKTMCTDIMEECIPSKTTSTKITQLWITKDLRTCQDGNKNYTIEQNAPKKQGTGTHTMQ